MHSMVHWIIWDTFSSCIFPDDNFFWRLHAQFLGNMVEQRAFTFIVISDWFCKHSRRTYLTVIMLIFYTMTLNLDTQVLAGFCGDQVSGDAGVQLGRMPDVSNSVACCLPSVFSEWWPPKLQEESYPRGHRAGVPVQQLLCFLFSNNSLGNILNLASPFFWTNLFWFRLNQLELR